MISVVIRSKNEADRLRLTLGSLRRQSADHEIIVVNDGSTDHTAAILDEASMQQPLQVVHHQKPKGRSGASNAGAKIARGEVLLFLDGDTLAGPDCLSHHAALHAKTPHVMGRGDSLHLRCTRMLLDPETGLPQADHREALSRRSPVELQRMRVSMAQVLEDFDAIDRRAERGVYPGAGPRRLAELEMQMLGDQHADCPVAWAAASGSNFSVSRDRFLDSGGFDERLDINEHRELALRLQKMGCRVRPVSEARSYHLTHRSGWRDPVADTDWETIFLSVHPEPEVALLIVFWASLSQGDTLAPEFQIRSLEALQRAADRESGVDYDEARRKLGARTLGAAFWRGETGPKIASTPLAMSA